MAKKAKKRTLTGCIHLSSIINSIYELVENLIIIFVNKIVNIIIKKETNHNKENQEETSLYLFLEENQKFPSWFKFGPNANSGHIVLPISKRKEITTVQEYKRSINSKSDSFLDGCTTDAISVFNFGKLQVGKDKSYIYKLSEIIVTNTITKDGKFLLILIIDAIVKPSRRKVVRTHFRTHIYEYEILCPIWQFSD